MDYRMWTENVAVQLDQCCLLSVFRSLDFYAFFSSALSFSHSHSFYFITICCTVYVLTQQISPSKQNTRQQAHTKCSSSSHWIVTFYLSARSSTRFLLIGIVTICFRKTHCVGSQFEHRNQFVQRTNDV